MTVETTRFVNRFRGLPLLPVRPPANRPWPFKAQASHHYRRSTHNEHPSAEVPVCVVEPHVRYGVILCVLCARTYGSERSADRSVPELWFRATHDATVDELPTRLASGSLPSRSADFPALWIRSVVALGGPVLLMGLLGRDHP